MSEATTTQIGYDGKQLKRIEGLGWVRICDVCMLPGSDMKSVFAEVRPSDGKMGTTYPTAEERLKRRVWEAEPLLPDFCGSCLELIKSLDWTKLGARHAHGMERYVTDAWPKPGEEPDA